MFKVSKRRKGKRREGRGRLLIAAAKSHAPARLEFSVKARPWFFAVNEYLHVLWGVSCQEFNKAKARGRPVYVRIFAGSERGNPPPEFTRVLEKMPALSAPSSRPPPRRRSFWLTHFS